MGQLQDAAASPTVANLTSTVERGKSCMPKNNSSEALGKTVFYVTVVAMLVFFWWLLIYDHGVLPAH